MSLQPSGTARQEPDAAASAATSSAPEPMLEDDSIEQNRPKVKRTNKKRQPKASNDDDPSPAKPKAKRKKDSTTDGSKKRKPYRKSGESATQMAVNEQMRRVLEDDAYSAVGSIVDTDTDDDDCEYRTRTGGIVRLDRNAIVAAMRKRLWMERMSINNSGKGGSAVIASSAAVTAPDDTSANKPGSKKTAPTPPAAAPAGPKEPAAAPTTGASAVAARSSQNTVSFGWDELNDDILDRDEGSIFGQTTGSSNVTWVECSKCKKWRRLRGVVDEKKLPQKWYCSMNKNDPDRARCSAPEEEYETPKTPENAADARTRKHLRVWVRRLESNESYEARQPTMTRGKKRNAAPSAKEPYEWVRCCNMACGKWRATLRCMDAKQHVLDKALRGEWYCVMNKWDEKLASCAAPQENLPAIGCPPWVMQDEN